MTFFSPNGYLHPREWGLQAFQEHVHVISRVYIYRLMAMYLQCCLWSFCRKSLKRRVMQCVTMRFPYNALSGTHKSNFLKINEKTSRVNVKAQICCGAHPNAINFFLSLLPLSLWKAHVYLTYKRPCYSSMCNNCFLLSTNITHQIFPTGIGVKVASLWVTTHIL